MWKLLLITLIFSSRESLAYKAAVLEYYPSTSAESAEDTILKNLNEYRSYADRAKEQAADIIVFPEYGLTTLVTNPENYSVEVTNSNSIIEKLSVIANERQMYLVVNLLEKETDANNQTKYFNTDLVFNRTGAIILKYQKINLYQEDYLTPGSDDQAPVFTTDFGVTFAVFTCIDILFTNPAIRVLKNNVTDVIFPTAWLSKPPFYSSLSVQHGYSVANGVNLLAANYGRPKDGRGGSGIYRADGRIAETYIADSASSKLLFQEISKVSARLEKTSCGHLVPYGLPGSISRLNVSDYVTQKDFNASRFAFKNINLTQDSSTQVCDGKFCCIFDISPDGDAASSGDIYKVMAFEGNVFWAGTTAHIRVCSLVPCQSDSNDSCGERMNPTTKFKRITVRGNFEKDKTAFYTPVTLNIYLLPIRDISYCDLNNGTNSDYIELGTNNQHGVLAFGIFGKTSLPFPETPAKTNNQEVAGNENSTSDNNKIGIVLFIFSALLFCLI